MSPPNRNAPASSMLTNPCAQAAIVRAAGSDASGPTSDRHGLDQWPADIRDRFRIGLHLGRDIREEEPVALLVRVDEGPVGDRRAAQVGPRVVGRDGLAKGATQVFGDGVGDGLDEGCPVGNVLVERGATHADPVADRGHRDGVEPTFLQQRTGRGEDGVA